MFKVRRRGVPERCSIISGCVLISGKSPLPSWNFFATWLEAEPEVPAGKWFKRFPEMIVCGEGELVRTFLRTGQVAQGEEVTG